MIVILLKDLEIELESNDYTTTLDMVKQICDEVGVTPVPQRIGTDPDKEWSPKNPEYLAPPDLSMPDIPYENDLVDVIIRLLNFHDNVTLKKLSEKGSPDVLHENYTDVYELLNKCLKTNNNNKLLIQEGVPDTDELNKLLVEMVNQFKIKEGLDSGEIKTYEDLKNHINKYLFLYEKILYRHPEFAIMPTIPEGDDGSFEYKVNKDFQDKLKDLIYNIELDENMGEFLPQLGNDDDDDYDELDERLPETNRLKTVLINMVTTILGVGAAVGAIIKKDLVVGFIKYLVKAAIAKLPAAATVAGTKIAATIIAGLTSPIGLGVIVGAALLYIIYDVCKGPSSKIRKKLKMLEGVFKTFIKNFMPRITNPITARRELTRGVSKLLEERKRWLYE